MCFPLEPPFIEDFHGFSIEDQNRFEDISQWIGSLTLSTNSVSASEFLSLDSREWMELIQKWNCEQEFPVFCFSTFFFKLFEGEEEVIHSVSRCCMNISSSCMVSTNLANHICQFRSRYLKLPYINTLSSQILKHCQTGKRPSHWNYRFGSKGQRPLPQPSSRTRLPPGELQIHPDNFWCLFIENLGNLETHTFKEAEKIPVIQCDPPACIDHNVRARMGQAPKIPVFVISSLFLGPNKLTFEFMIKFQAWKLPKWRNNRTPGNPELLLPLVR